MLTKSHILNISAGTIALALLTACGGSGDSDPVAETARFSLAVSDAPVDSADEVWACFSAVELKGNGESDLVFEIGGDSNTIETNDVCKDANGDTIANTRGINLLEFTGSDSINLLSGATVPAGTYSQLRLIMADGSYVVQGNTNVELAVPSNELKFDSLTLDANSNANYTIEFDLRKALVNPVGQDRYLLKPRGVRLVDNQEIGHIEGTVAEALLINNQCTVAPADATTPVAVVYLYPGQDLELATLADVGGSEANESYAVAPVLYDGVSAYNFEIGFVAAGDYVAALTCNTEDDPETDDDISFLSGINATVAAGEEVTTVDFGTD